MPLACSLAVTGLLCDGFMTFGNAFLGDWRLLALVVGQDRVCATARVVAAFFAVSQQ